MNGGRGGRGFTLIELMIVVAIIGILASIAIPNFMKFQAKAKQAEVKQNLGAIYTAMLTYFSTGDTYPNDALIGVDPWGCWRLMNWSSTSGETRYTYQCGTNPSQKLALSPSSIAAGCLATKSTTASTDTQFTVAATGNIDNDMTCCDEWAMNDAKVMKNQQAAATWGASMNDVDLETC